MQYLRMPTGHQPWVTHKEHLIEPQRWGPMLCEVTVSVSILMAFEGASGTISMCVATHLYSWNYFIYWYSCTQGKVS